MHPILEISALGDGGGVRLKGELEFETSRDLSNAFRALNTDSEVLLDVTELTFIDGSALSALFRFADSLNGSGSLVLLDPPPGVERVCEIVGLTEHPKIEIRYSSATSLPPSEAGISDR